MTMNFTMQGYSQTLRLEMKLFNSNTSRLEDFILGSSPTYSFHYKGARTSASLVKVNSTYMKHKLWPRPTLLHRLVQTIELDTVQWDQKGWPGSEIQMYYVCPCGVIHLVYCSKSVFVLSKLQIRLR